MSYYSEVGQNARNTVGVICFVAVGSAIGFSAIYHLSQPPFENVYHQSEGQWQMEGEAGEKCLLFSQMKTFQEADTDIVVARFKGGRYVNIYTPSGTTLPFSVGGVRTTKSVADFYTDPNDDLEVHQIDLDADSANVAILSLSIIAGDDIEVTGGGAGPVTAHIDGGSELSQSALQNWSDCIATLAT